MLPDRRYKRMVLEQVAPFASPEEVKKEFGIPEYTYQYYTSKYNIPTYTQASRDRKQAVLAALSNSENETKRFLFENLK